MRKKVYFSQISAWLVILIFILVLSALPRQAEAFTEDFESGAAGWTTEGTWALITSDYHSADHCMTDSPDENYPADANTALVSPYIQLPGSTPIIMTFWHHHQFANHYGTVDDDYGYVEITTDRGLNWDLLVTIAGSNSSWKYESIDLSAYAGGTVKVRIRLHERGDGGTLDGWYIDDVNIPGNKVVDNPSYLLVEDFENGAPGWILEGTWDFITSDYHSFEHCVTDSPEGNYLADANSAIISPPVDIPNITPVILTFWQHRQLANHYGTGDDDYGYVEISRFPHLDWDPLTYYGGSISTWHQRSLDLSAYSGDTVKVRFRLHERGTGATADGWYIDDVSIEVPTPPPPQIAISPPSGYYAATQEFDLVIITEPSPCSVVDLRATFDGTDVTALLGSCLITGNFTIGTQTGQTFRCPAVSNLITTGYHTLNIDLDFDLCESGGQSAVWYIVPNTEGP